MVLRVLLLTPLLSRWREEMTENKTIFTKAGERVDRVNPLEFIPPRSHPVMETALRKLLTGKTSPVAMPVFSGQQVC
jgi:hypothetical protein